MGTIMVIAIILLLVIVVGQRQQIKRTGSILINRHCKGITKSSSHAVAEPAALYTVIDSSSALTCIVAVE